MSKFKVGDKVVATEGLGEYFKTGAKGVVVKVDQSLCLVAFTEGDYKKDRGFLNKKGQWWGYSDNMELVKDVSMQSGDGAAIQAWAVEVDGEISSWQTYPSRKIAREERGYFENYGHKAHVRKVEIRKVKGKV